MNSIAKFFTFYWIIYFPTCIAYNDLPSMGYVDEVMTVILIGYTFMMKGNQDTNPEPWKEFRYFLLILSFYIVYSLIRQVNVPGAVWKELVQQIRPYSIVYCTWILNPRFTKTQKKWMLTAMMVTLGSWIYYHPATIYSQNAEFPVLGQLAVTTGMAFYLFSEDKSINKYIALLLVLTGMLAPKFKFMGEVVCFVAVIFYLKEKLDFKSPQTITYGIILMTIVLFVTWERFDAYYWSGWERHDMARPESYKTSLKILVDYFPFGPGMGTFGTMGARDFYSPLLYEYGLNKIWGMSPDFNRFIADAFYPTLSQYGIVGVILFCIYWRRRLLAFNKIEDMRYYRIAFITFFCLAIEQTADTSWLSGKGMGYCMLIGLCLNANLNKQRDDEEEQFEKEEEERRKRRRIEGMEEMRKDGNGNDNLNYNGNGNDNLNPNPNLNGNGNENENENLNENENENENVEGDFRHG